MRINIELFTFCERCESTWRGEKRCWYNSNALFVKLITFSPSTLTINWCKLRIFTFCTWAVDACCFGHETANWYDSWMNHIWQVATLNRTKNTKQFHSTLNFQCICFKTRQKTKLLLAWKKFTSFSKKFKASTKKKRAVLTFMIWAGFYDLIVKRFSIKYGLVCITFVSNLSQIEVA